MNNLTEIHWINRHGEARRHCIPKNTYFYALDWFRRSIVESQGVMTDLERARSKLRLVKIVNFQGKGPKLSAHDIVMTVIDHWENKGQAIPAVRIAEKIGRSYGTIVSVLHRDRTWTDTIRAVKVSAPVRDKKTGELLRFRPFLAYRPTEEILKTREENRKKSA